MSAAVVFHQDMLDFIHQGLSITVASRDPRCIPSISKALACRVLPETQEIHIFINATEAGSLLADIANSGGIAVTYCLPSSHKTIQIKGSAAYQRDVQAGDLEYSQAYIQSLLQDLGSLGYPLAVMSRYLYLDPDQLTVISFQPDSVFEQSPGEKAGEPMEID